MTLINVVPDKEWVEEPRAILFKVPRDIGRCLDSPLRSNADKDVAYQVLYAAAYNAIKDAMNRPSLAGFEVNTSKNPFGLSKTDFIESPEEIVSRTMNDAPRKAVELSKEDVDMWRIWVWAKRRKRLFKKYPDQLGPSDGVEAFDDLPDDMKKELQPVYEEK